MEWYEVKGIEQIDSPALVVYKDRIIRNLEKMISLTGNPDRLMPHVKTHKMKDIVQLNLSLGITKFKCATIAEAEMIAMAGGKTVLIALQPVGPKLQRIVALIKKYPDVCYSVIVDNHEVLQNLDAQMLASGLKVGIYVDINTGMNRTGILPGEEAEGLIKRCSSLNAIELKGLHAYDGHNILTDMQKRKSLHLEEYKPVYDLLKFAENSCGKRLELISGGTPTFPLNALSKKTICSPGTTVLWDAASRERFPDLPFEYAALVITRVVSVIGKNLLCLDLGHKAIAAETPLPRVKFLNHPEIKPISQSEEHMVAEVPDNGKFNHGDILYGVPWHICPTCALYQEAIVIMDHQRTEVWPVTARNRFLTV